MKKIFCLAISLLSCGLYAQNVVIPHQQLLLDTSNNLYITPISFHIQGGTNRADIGLKGLGKGSEFLRDHVLGDQAFTTGMAQYSLNLADITYKIDSKSTFGIKFQNQTVSNFWDMDGRLLAEIDETDQQKLHKSYPYNLNAGNRMQATLASYNRISFSYGRELFRANNNVMIASFTGHILQPLSMSGIDAFFEKGNVGGNAEEGWGYLNNASGTVHTLTSGEFFNKPNIGNLFRANGKNSLAADFHFSYSLIDPTSSRPYKLHINAGVMDLGKVKYEMNPTYTKAYMIAIEGREALYFNQSLKGVSINQTAKVFDRYPNLFTPEEQTLDEYAVSLAGRFVFGADYWINNNWAVDLSADLPLTASRQLDQLYAFRTVYLSPRYVKGNLRVSLPVAYRSFTGLDYGLGLGWNGCYLHWGNLLSAAAGNSKMMDIAFGTSWKLNKKIF